MLADVLGTKAGRLVAAEFADPARLAALGVSRFTRFAATRGPGDAPRSGERLVASRRGRPTSRTTHFALFQKYRCGTRRLAGPPCSG